MTSFTNSSKAIEPVVNTISQAPSPESNPNSPLPVNAMVGQYPTIES